MPSAEFIPPPPPPDTLTPEQEASNRNAVERGPKAKKWQPPWEVAPEDVGKAVAWNPAQKPERDIIRGKIRNGEIPEMEDAARENPAGYQRMEAGIFDVRKMAEGNPNVKKALEKLEEEKKQRQKAAVQEERPPIVSRDSNFERFLGAEKGKFFKKNDREIWGNIVNGNGGLEKLATRTRGDPNYSKAWAIARAVSVDENLTDRPSAEEVAKEVMDYKSEIEQVGILRPIKMEGFGKGPINPGVIREMELLADFAPDTKRESQESYVVDPAELARLLNVFQNEVRTRPGALWGIMNRLVEESFEKARNHKEIAYRISDTRIRQGYDRAKEALFASALGPEFSTFLFVKGKVEDLNNNTLVGVEQGLRWEYKNNNGEVTPGKVQKLFELAKEIPGTPLVELQTVEDIGKGNALDNSHMEMHTIVEPIIASMREHEKRIPLKDLTDHFEKRERTYRSTGLEKDRNIAEEYKRAVEMLRYLR